MVDTFIELNIADSIAGAITQYRKDHGFSMHEEAICLFEDMNIDMLNVLCRNLDIVGSHRTRTYRFFTLKHPVERVSGWCYPPKISFTFYPWYGSEEVNYSCKCLITSKESDLHGLDLIEIVKCDSWSHCLELHEKKQTDLNFESETISGFRNED